MRQDEVAHFMNPKRNRFLVAALGALLGSLMVWAGASLLASEFKREAHKVAFSRLQHPQGTSLVDPVSMKIEYYPATYVNDSVHFEAAYLVGELRKYTGNWRDVQAFYGSKNVEPGVPILVLPVEFNAEDPNASLEIANGYAFSPFDYDVLSAIQHEYSFRSVPLNLNEAEPGLYLVFCVWP